MLGDFPENIKKQLLMLGSLEDWSLPPHFPSLPPARFSICSMQELISQPLPGGP